MKRIFEEANLRILRDHDGEIVPIFKDRQELFDAVCSHMLKQSKKCQDSSNTCVHFLPDKDAEWGVNGPSDFIACAIGGIIPDDAQQAVLDCYNTGTTPRGLIRGVPALAEHWGIDEDSDGDLLFLRSLQMIHDGCHIMAWADELRKLAEEKELNWKGASFYLCAYHLITDVDRKREIVKAASDAHIRLTEQCVRDDARLEESRRMRNSLGNWISNANVLEEIAFAHSNGDDDEHSNDPDN